MNHMFGRAPDSKSWPALSLRQPWLWAIFELGKDIENRRWNTTYRGHVWLHAAKGCTTDEAMDALGWMTERRLMKPMDARWPGLERVERGGICGVAEIYDVLRPRCRELWDGPLEHGAPAAPWHMPEQWGFCLRNVTRIELVPCKGALGLFRLPADVEPLAVASFRRVTP
jgi:hypothetical protein